MVEQASAWVESPLQMLCAVEAHHAGLLGPETAVVPRAGLRPLKATRRELRSLGLPDGLVLAEPRERMPRRVQAVGDAFSGKVQLRWLTSRPGRIVIVDDGLATLRLLELLAAGPYRPLLRARAHPTRLRSALGLAAALRLRYSKVSVFTALSVDDKLAEAVRQAGVDLVRHDFAWLRAQPPSAQGPAERTVVLGTSLVRNGLVHRDHYLRWLTDLAAREPLAYYPHRREDPVDVALIRERPGITVHDAGVPAELTLRGLDPGQRVLSLPSTAITSLRVLLSPRGVAVEPVDVPDDWWTSRAAPALRSHLTGVSS
ncbi:hypothetical protein [Nonomuraea gerenzanensis]|uniref:Uncharacterized protein n=1 Tax=Nonomuraea gerenzanensis TaxID=93944 RepID=A0A1M4E8C9_9ACTN|nr:hypothetical protein [Nonomuraea gerenzanensis]UBU17288.1 hypothetical protein LCN96_20370 [Nonomuraea gerenzanensis]SBO95032.1 FIG01122203: hypothetical protein [Nonomuraea gerenzanensis]